MKIKIIKSPAFNIFLNYKTLPPLSLGCIYAFLKKKGYDISQHDLNVSGYCRGNDYYYPRVRNKLIRLFFDQERLVRYLKGRQEPALDDIVGRYLEETDLKNTDILLVSVYSNDLCSSVMSLLISAYFKHRCGGKTVIAGGEWLQRGYIYENFELYNSLGIIDYQVMGYGEIPLEMLLQKLDGRDVGLEQIPGLAYALDGRVFKNPANKHQVLISPCFDGLPLERYRWQEAGFFAGIPAAGFPSDGNLMLPFQSIHGCANRCSFCLSSADSKLYYLDPQEAVASLAKLRAKYGTRYFFLLDNQTNISAGFIKDFCNRILDSGLDIIWSACANFTTLDDPQTLKLMRKAGACRLIFGLETASPRLLEIVEKKVDLQDVRRKLAWCNEAGIWTEMEIIAGLPHENQEDVRATVKFISDNRSSIDGVFINRFYLVEGSLMLKSPANYGLTNVRSYHNFAESFRTGVEAWSYSFDEVGGLSWEEKKCQINESYNRVYGFLKANDAVSGAVKDESNVIFYLYSHLSDKEEIAYYLRLYRNYYNNRLTPLPVKLLHLSRRIRMKTSERLMRWKLQVHRASDTDLCSGCSQSCISAGENDREDQWS